MLGYEELANVMEEITKNISDHGSPEVFKEEFEAFGMDFDEIGSEMKSQLGTQDAAKLISGIHIGLCLAAKYWDYRTPPTD